MNSEMIEKEWDRLRPKHAALCRRINSLERRRLVIDHRMNLLKMMFDAARRREREESHA